MTGGTCTKLLEQAGMEYDTEGTPVVKASAPAQTATPTQPSGLDPIHDDYGYVTC